MRRPAAILLGTVATLLPGCGHRGDPRPPLRRTPPTPQEFRLAQRGEVLELRAVAPTASVDGVVYETITLEFQVAEGTGDLEKTGRRHAVVASPGQPVAFTVPLPPPGKTVRAAARGTVGRERGQRTLTMALVTQAPLTAPSELVAALAEDGVALSWRGPRPKEADRPSAAAPAGAPPSPATPAAPATTPDAAPSPTTPDAAGEAPAAAEEAAAGPRRSGFVVYRRIGGAEYAEPLAGEPLERRSLKDTTAPQGATVCYVVRASASTEPLVESGPSDEACVTVRDIAAPGRPAGLAVLPREGGLEILWSPSAEPDLAGYRVYRAAPGGEPGQVAEVATNRSAWLDESARRGVVYRYAVTAFDLSGNESEPTELVEASLP